MNWLTWRQYRSQAVAGYGGLAVVGVFILLTGLAMLNHLNSTGLAQCLRVVDADCNDLIDSFRGRFNSTQFFALFVLLVPALVGMFWGAPLVARELEQGTHRLAWTQGITRRRWITSKLAIVGGSTVALSALLTAGVWWWMDPNLLTGWNRFDPGLFDQLGIVPIAYTLFAFTLGVAIGTVIKKALPAAFATMGAFAAVRIAFLVFVRERLMPAKTAVFGLAEDAGALFNSGGNWVLSERTLDASGNLVSGFGGISAEYMDQACPGLGQFPAKEDVLRCFDQLGIQTEVAYHPADRFWTFQAIEAAIFVGLAALLVWFIVRRVRRLG